MLHYQVWTAHPPSLAGSNVRTEKRYISMLRCSSGGGARYPAQLQPDYDFVGPYNNFPAYEAVSPMFPLSGDTVSFVLNFMVRAIQEGGASRMVIDKKYQARW